MAQSLLRLPAVMERTGFKRSQIYKLIQQGEFPAPITLGTRTSAWPSDDIDRWVRAKIAASRKGGK